MSFDDFLKTKNRKKISEMRPIELFEAGAQSRQAEIDELQNKLKGAVKTNEMLVAYKNELLDEIKSIVKGNKND